MSPTLFFNHRNNNQIPSKRLCSFSCNACCLACVVCPWSCKLVSSQFHSYTTLSVFPTVYRKGSLLSQHQSLSEHYRAKLPTTESESKLMTRHSFMWRTLRFEFYCGVSRRCPGKTLRLRKIAPLCSLKLVVDAISGFHFLKETLETTFNLVRRTCSSNPLSVKSMIPSPSKEANISPDVAKCFVKVLADLLHRQLYQWLLAWFAQVLVCTCVLRQHVSSYPCQYVWQPATQRRNRTKPWECPLSVQSLHRLDF